mmetsp:Transcript_25370/g.80294  ORF Transcript_25370/g.80294 Transcript_25370/m.80294 type:complete len:212 (-) Transcript_25370:337-972(-)
MGITACRMCGRSARSGGRLWPRGRSAACPSPSPPRPATLSLRAKGTEPTATCLSIYTTTIPHGRLFPTPAECACPPLSTSAPTTPGCCGLARRCTRFTSCRLGSLNSSGRPAAQARPHRQGCPRAASMCLRPSCTCTRRGGKSTCGTCGGGRRLHPSEPSRPTISTSKMSRPGRLQLRSSAGTLGQPSVCTTHPAVARPQKWARPRTRRCA